MNPNTMFWSSSNNKQIELNNIFLYFNLIRQINNIYKNFTYWNKLLLSKLKITYLTKIVDVFIQKKNESVSPLIQYAVYGK